MKVLQVNCVYGRGSTGMITSAIHHALLEQGHESVVCYGRQQAPEAPCVHKVCNDFFGKINHGVAMVTGLMYGGCLFSTGRLVSRIKREQPDIVHLHCLNGNFVNIYRLISWLKASGIPTVLTLHAEFMYTANCSHGGDCSAYQRGCGDCPDFRKYSDSLFWNRTGESFHRMMRSFRGFSKLAVVGPSCWICKRGQKSAILKDKSFYTIHNGVDTSVFHTNNKQKYREICNIMEEEKMVLMVTPSFGRVKGGDLFLRLAEMASGTGLRFVVAGADRPEDYAGEVAFLGRIADRTELAELYASANAVVIPSRQDTYPTVCLEAAACGTPVIGFDVGGVAEAIGNGLGQVVPAGDVAAMLAAVKRVCETPKEVWSKQAEPLQETLSDRRMCEAYLDLYGKMLKGA